MVDGTSGNDDDTSLTDAFRDVDGWRNIEPRDIPLHGAGPDSDLVAYEYRTDEDADGDADEANEPAGSSYVVGLPGTDSLDFFSVGSGRPASTELFDAIEHKRGDGESDDPEPLDAVFAVADAVGRDAVTDLSIGGGVLDRSPPGEETASGPDGPSVGTKASPGFRVEYTDSSTRWSLRSDLDEPQSFLVVDPKLPDADAVGLPSSEVDGRSVSTDSKLTDWVGMNQYSRDSEGPPETFSPSEMELNPLLKPLADAGHPPTNIGFRTNGLTAETEEGGEGLICVAGPQPNLLARQVRQPERPGQSIPWLPLQSLDRDAQPAPDRFSAATEWEEFRRSAHRAGQTMAANRRTDDEDRSNEDREL